MAGSKLERNGKGNGREYGKERGPEVVGEKRNRMEGRENRRVNELNGVLNSKLLHSRLKPWKLAYHLTFPSSYFRMFLPERYALPHPNSFKFHAPTSALVRVPFVYQLLPPGTHCLSAFASVNL